MKVVSFTHTNYKTILAEMRLVLHASGLVVYPTETCYGIGALATDKTAVSRLLEYKGGRKNKAISVAVADMLQAQTLVTLNSEAKHLYDTFLPGPVTVISESRGVVDRRLETAHRTLGIRVPDSPLLLDLLKDLDLPITATSANTSGKKTPFSLADLERYTSKRKLQMISLFLHAGLLPHRPSSTVVDTTLPKPEVLRLGEALVTAERQYESNEEVESIAIGEKLSTLALPLLETQAVVVALSGSLGAGKTQLVKGMGMELGIQEPIVSPTYQLLREYEYQCGKVCGKLVHIDTWRMREGAELSSLVTEEMLRTPGMLLAIEWPEQVGDILNEWKSRVRVVRVHITDLGDIRREILVSGL